MDLADKVKSVGYWYHKIDLPGGITTPGWAPLKPEKYCIPADLTGKRVLDIGAWDGYWTWEALKRGASEVLAIDDFSDDIGLKFERKGWESFDICREAFGFNSKTAVRLGDNTVDPNSWANEHGQVVSRYNMSVYHINEQYLGQFDVIFFFGTIYHLKHPLLALEKISQICKGSIYIETASLDECSPYRGGIGAGYDRNDMVMEFYPGKEYAANESNWWVPTLQCLGAMLHSVGFKDIECWPYSENPKQICECRGFASGTKDPEKEPACHPPEVENLMVPQIARVAAVMSVPRLGFTDNMTCAQEALFPLRIPLINVQGAFWGQCLERGMQQLIDAGVDIVLTIDYDTAFKKADVEELIRLMQIHPEAAAMVPVQRGRAHIPMLLSMKTRSGQPRKDIPLTELQEHDVVPIHSGHFGLTAFRVKDLLDIPHPWLWGQPNSDNQWGAGKIDDDIWFWKQLEKAGKQAYLATRVVVGHMELMIRWPDESMQPIYQVPGQFHDNGKPDKVWK